MSEVLVMGFVELFMADLRCQMWVQWSGLFYWFLLKYLDIESLKVYCKIRIIDGNNIDFSLGIEDGIKIGVIERTDLDYLIEFSRKYIHVNIVCSLNGISLGIEDVTVLVSSFRGFGGQVRMSKVESVVRVTLLDHPKDQDIGSLTVHCKIVSIDGKLLAFYLGLNI